MIQLPSQRLVDAGVFPILFRSSTPRTGGPEIPGAYSHARSVWVIGDGAQAIPIVEASDVDLLEITTKTKVDNEVDDDQLVALGGRPSTFIPELLTKTDVQQESDDAISASAGLLELETKTAVNQESDDESWPVRHLLELETKTEAEVEHDDDSHPVL